MRTGTVTCWLFGHKFVIWSWTPERDNTNTVNILRLMHKDYCVRCGINKNEK